MDVTALIADTRVIRQSVCTGDVATWVSVGNKGQGVGMARAGRYLLSLVGPSDSMDYIDKLLPERVNSKSIERNIVVIAFQRRRCLSTVCDRECSC